MNKIFDIYQSKSNKLSPSKKGLEYKQRSSKDKTLMEVLGEFLFISFSDKYHPTDRYWMDYEIKFHNQNNSAIYMGYIFNVKEHNNLVEIGSTIEDAQDNLILK